MKDLLQLEAAIVSELRGRGLVRTNNKPLGDIAEQIVLAARGGGLEPNSTKSHDVTSLDGRRIQVKAMGACKVGRAGTFSPFRSFGFDTAVFRLRRGDLRDRARARGPRCRFRGYWFWLVSSLGRCFPPAVNADSGGGDFEEAVRAEVRGS